MLLNGYVYLFNGKVIVIGLVNIEKNGDVNYNLLVKKDIDYLNGDVLNKFV